MLSSIILTKEGSACMQLSFGEKLKNLRDEHGLYQKDLASIMNVSRNSVSDLECGRIAPNAHHLLAVSKHFGMSIDSLLEHTAPEEEVPKVLVLYNQLNKLNRVRAIERIECLLELQNK